MKLAGAQAAGFCGHPDRRLAGALLHGPDPGLLAIRRRELVAALTEGDDLRLTRLEPAAAQKDPAEVDAALKTRGFFPGRRVLLIEGARDGLAASLAPVLATVEPGDAFLVLTAEGPGARSPLRKLFEQAPNLASLGLYPERPGVPQLTALLSAAGMQAGLESDAAQLLAEISAELDRGALLQLVERVAVHCLERSQPLGRDELADLLPLTVDSEAGRLADAVAAARAEAIGPLIGRLAAAGLGPQTMLIVVERHLRRLLAVAAAGDGAEAALDRLRPPVFGAQRQALAAAARHWGLRRLEAASRILFQTERSLRSAGYRPDRAMVERCLIRLAMMASAE